MLIEAAFSNAFHVARRRVVFYVVYVCHTKTCCRTLLVLLRVGQRRLVPTFLNVRLFELYKYTSTIFDSFELSLPNQLARHTDWRRKQERKQRTAVDTASN